MSNKYLDKMLMQPDYVVVYDADKNFYYGDTLNREDYKKLQYDMFIYSTKVKMLVGYAASKSHPNNPVKVYISLDMRDCLGKRLEHHYIRVNKVVNEQSERYEGKHDLFIYSDYNVAVLAGKEMQYLDEIEKYKNLILKTYNNFDFGALTKKYQKYIDDNVLTEENKNKMNNFINKIFNPSEETKGTVKNSVNKVKDYAKSGIERLIKELDNIDIPKQKPEYVKNEKDFALYKQLTDEYAVLLKHRNRNGLSRYTVNIIKLTLDTNKTYDITFEQFCDIYEILNEDAEGRLKFNSIMDILGNQIFDEEPIETVKEKSKKTNSIQFCQFRAEDKIPSEPRPGKAKFKMGDLVYIKSMGINGHVVEILDTRTNAGKIRKLYKVICGPHKYKAFFSYELEKA